MSEETPTWAPSLRLLTILSFIPAFPLCLVHGVISHQVVPAIGLLPLAFSSGIGIFLLSRYKKEDKRTHPALVFCGDTILATALMVVLVFTWVTGPKNTGSGHSMLAAYCTVPLMGNFFIHLLFALHTFYFGLHINTLVEWLAWQAAPAECPNCHHSLQAPTPTFPSVSIPSITFSSMSAPTLPKFNAPKMPSMSKFTSRWRSDPKGEYEPLFHGGEQTAYDEEAGEASHGGAIEEPEVSEVVRKKRKGKDNGGSPPAVDESAPWA